MFRLGWAAVWPGLLLAQNASADSAPLDVSGKLYYHYEKVYSPFSLLESGFQAAILQWNDDPREWGQGSLGLWRRTASTVGYDTIRNTFMFTLDSISRADRRYFRAEEGSSVCATAPGMRSIRPSSATPTMGKKFCPGFASPQRMASRSCPTTGNRTGSTTTATRSREER